MFHCCEHHERGSGQGPEDTVLTFYMTDSVTSAAITNGTAVLTRASGDQMTVP